MSRLIVHRYADPYDIANLAPGLEAASSHCLHRRRQFAEELVLRHGGQKLFSALLQEKAADLEKSLLLGRSREEAAAERHICNVFLRVA